MRIRIEVYYKDAKQPCIIFEGSEGEAQTFIENINLNLYTYNRKVMK